MATKTKAATSKKAAPKKVKTPPGKKAVVVVHLADGSTEFMWTLHLNGRPYAAAPVSYTRHAAAVDSANRFADMLAFPVLVITQSDVPDA
jgi:hypothetical protein